MILEIMSTFPDSTVKMAAYAEDFPAGETIKALKHWWAPLCKLDPKFGYYSEAKKVVVKKEDLKEKAESAYTDLSVKITFTGRRHFALQLEKHHLKKNTSMKRSISGLRSNKLYVKLLNLNHKRF